MESADSIARMDKTSRNSVSIVGLPMRLFSLYNKSDIQGHSLSCVLLTNLLSPENALCAFNEAVKNLVSMKFRLS